MSTAIVPQETEGADRFSRPEKRELENRQLTLFQAFLSNTDDQRDQLSNAIDLWDCVPCYSVSPVAMTKARIQGEFLRKHQIEFQHRGSAYKCIISPARVADFDGVDRDFYPSASEQLVEGALRKLATENRPDTSTSRTIAAASCSPSMSYVPRWPGGGMPARNSRLSNP